MGKPFPVWNGEPFAPARSEQPSRPLNAIAIKEHFREIPVGPVPVRIFYIFWTGRGREYNYRYHYKFFLPADLPQTAFSIHSRHIDIEEDDIGNSGLREVQQEINELPPVCDCRQFRPNTRIHQRLPKKGLVVLIILRYKNSNIVHCLLFNSTPRPAQRIPNSTLRPVRLVWS
jgi:hypothetical protein